MAAKKFGYVRVSTNLDRQIHILRDEEGIDERDIYVEKESGRQFERPVYRSLVDNILREGNLLVVTELKRFGRRMATIVTMAASTAGRFSSSGWMKSGFLPVLRWAGTGNGIWSGCRD